MTTLNIEKRIKRHVIGSRLDFFAATPARLRILLPANADGTIPIHQGCRHRPGGVLFDGRLTDLYLANLHLRTAGRVLLRLASFRATAFRQLEKRRPPLPGLSTCQVERFRTWTPQPVAHACTTPAPSKNASAAALAPIGRPWELHPPLNPSSAC
jgi:hypothetical protein